ncbi:hypothetical protein OSB04_025872 [Centaurea solstitialis]|uniref:Uncharacterized protein n=1 Tax=Centaurea solstitialis TaxID=347529 RepID=A0AA38SNV6_9ASTR|nr:hypothetical protein OSB04_025872 [Centaurea solstitialis]
MSVLEFITCIWVSFLKTIQVFFKILSAVIHDVITIMIGMIGTIIQTLAIFQLFNFMMCTKNIDDECSILPCQFSVTTA